MAFPTVGGLPTANQYSPAGPYNVFIPGYDGDARARLLVEYALNPKKFAMNGYVTIQTVTLPAGYYQKILQSDYVRVPYSDGRDMIWPDGEPSDAYSNMNQGPRQTNVYYELHRIQKSRRVGWLTQQNSAYDELKKTQNMLTGIMMTYRTIQVLNVALNPANYASTHYGTATAVGGGFWSQGTINQPFIKTALDNIRDVIIKDSIGMVDVDDLRLVVSPTLANAMSRSVEIRGYLAQQVGSLAVLEGKTPDAKLNWSLPKYYNGFEILIEKAVQVNTLVTDNDSTDNIDGPITYIMPVNTAYVCARPGSLVSEDGGVNFSTVHLLEMKGHAFKVYMEDLGEREQATYTRVEDFFQPIVPAPETGFIVTNCTS